MNRFVIYHADCPDGFCAAWVVAMAMPPDELAEMRFVPAHYGDPLPDGIDGAEVIVLDFSYPLEQSLELRRRAAAFWQLDHHKTAEEGHREIADNKGFIFDQSRSGARLAWDHFACGSAIRESFYGYDARNDRHWLVEYVQDRDLWKWELEGSRAVSAAIGALPMRGSQDFEAWRDFADRGVSQALHAGEQILAANERYVEKTAARAGRAVIHAPDCPVPNGASVDCVANSPCPVIPIVNTTHLTSDVLEKLVVGHPFAVGWFQTADGVFHYSLRSALDGSDVSAIAKSFGGGGHPHAAGFESRSLVHELVGGRRS
jgi:oligoribonuclease NrnB/cAMP/cGMP phosphodiesterase (DHH superfamily)